MEAEALTTYTSARSRRTGGHRSRGDRAGGASRRHRSRWRTPRAIGPDDQRSPGRQQRQDLRELRHRRADLRRAGGGGHHHRLPDPGADPAGRARGPRPHRPGQDRHRQDPRVRRARSCSGWTRCPAAASRPRRARWSSCRPGNWPSRSPMTSRSPGAGSAPRWSCSTAAGPTSRRSRRWPSVDIVVGTPGRLLDLARQRHLNLGHVHALVLDEADKMLDLGFLPDVERILSLTPADRQTMLFSATMPGEVVTLARRHLSQPMHIRAEQHDEQAYVPSTQQFIYRAHQMDKIEVLARVLQAEGRGLSIVFCRTKRSADQVAERADDPRLRRGRGARRPGPGPARAGHARVPHRQGRRPGRHRRRRPRARRRRRHARDQLRVPRGREGLPAPHRAHRPGRADRRGGHVRGLERPVPLEDDRRHCSASVTPSPPRRTPPRSTCTATWPSRPGPRAPCRGPSGPRAGLEAEQLEDIGETGRIRSRSAQPSRGRSRRGGSERGPDRGPAAGDEDREPTKRRQRVRRRLHSGAPTADGQAGAPSTGTPTATTASAQARAADGGPAPADQGSPADSATAGTATASRPPRRRRQAPAPQVRGRHRQPRTARPPGPPTAHRPGAEPAGSGRRAERQPGG